jgi:hypothetical protein
MHTYVHAVHDIKRLDALLESASIQAEAAKSTSILVQVTPPQPQEDWILQVSRTILDKMPSAIVTGAAQIAGEAARHAETGSTAISFTFFPTTKLTPIVLACDPGDEWQAGKCLWDTFCANAGVPVGMLLVSPNIVTNSPDGARADASDCSARGDGVVTDDAPGQPLVFLDTRVFYRSIVAVLFTGKDLHTEASQYLGWSELFSAISPDASVNCNFRIQAH